MAKVEGNSRTEARFGRGGAAQVYGYYGMRTTIDKAGRVVIPAALRERAGLTPGSELTDPTKQAYRSRRPMRLSTARYACAIARGSASDGVSAAV